MANQFNNQRCSKCYQKYSGLKATCYDSICNQEHFFKRSGQLFCIKCLMEEGSIKCQKCSKIITRLEEMGKWRRNVVLVDDHTFDINNFGCECRECNHSGNEKNKLKRCQGTFSVHYNGGHEANNGSTQFNQCDSAVPIAGGDFCQHCKGQTETYQQLRTRISSEEKQCFEKFKQAYEKAQNYWNSFSSSERERECERIVENIKLGKYWLGEFWVNRDVEGYCSGWAHNGSFWGIKNGKLTSSTPHLPPIELAEEFMEKEIGFYDSKMKEGFSDFLVVKKDDNDNSPSKVNPTFSPNNSPSQLPPSENNQVQQPNTSQPIKKENASENSRNKLENGVKNNSEIENKENDNEVQTINWKGIKKIILRENSDLEIEFNSTSIATVITNEQINNSQELRKIRNFCQQNNKNSLNQQEVNNILNANSTNSESTGKPTDNKNHALTIGLSITAALIVGLAIGLLLKRKKRVVKKS